MPLPHAIADPIDPRTRLKPVLRPFRLEFQLAGFLPRTGDGQEIPALAAPVRDLAGDPLLIEPEVPGRLVERRIEDRILDDWRRHAASIDEAARSRFVS